MGGIVGGWMFKCLVFDVVVCKWMLLVVVGSGLGGYFVGFGGVVGVLVGGGIVDKLGKYDCFKKILLGVLVGVLVGKVLWDVVFFLVVFFVLFLDLDGEIVFEIFVCDKICGL